MRLSVFKARIDALESDQIGSLQASLMRALDKKEIKRCSKAWDAFARDCTGETARRQSLPRQVAPSPCLPPVA